MNRRTFVVAALWGAAAAGCSRKLPAGGAGVARRVVSVAPATTEALFAIGAGDRVVGRSRFCDWPAEAARVPVVGGFVDVDLEAILGRSPDLVVGSLSPSSPRLAAQLEARGIASWFPDLASCAAIESMVLGLGDRTGEVSGAHRVTDALHERIGAVERAVAGLAPRRVLLLAEIDPPVAAGPSSFVDELISRAHATNVIRAGPPWQTLNLEQVADLDPEILLDATTEPGARPAIDPAAPGWRSSSAARAGHVAGVKDARLLRPGPRVGEGLAVLARAIHPEAPLAPG
jgi:iron complex transport system substrate-binding protein